ncbi:MAG TPA: hypothetical protein VNN76_08820 [Bacteroidota bacterium]|nr:hypothetical protein [Bacteroidota bacterium]
MKNPALIIFLLFAFPLDVQSSDRPANPVLEFPQSGTDDPTRYHGYSTRFYRDAKENVVQIILNRATGRVVHLWGNSANEAISFTVRNPDGSPAALTWGPLVATVGETEHERTLTHEVRSSTSKLVIGHFMMGSMRKERDFQHFERHLLPFDSEPFHERELLELIENLLSLPESERKTHLSLLRARSVEELKERMSPSIRISTEQNDNVALIDQRTFDGKNRLTIELIVDRDKVELQPEGNSLRASSIDNSPLSFRIRIHTDSPPLTPLDQGTIFTEEFKRFLEGQRKLQRNRPSVTWLDRNLKGLELLSYKEKLMAGLPNFATYFGRDMMMSALMFEPIWSAEMLEHVISTVLRKISPRGEVSHEESLGGQAIRENAAEYNKIIVEFHRLQREGNTKKANNKLQAARSIIENLQATREDYKMLDDDFQLPVLLGLYIDRPDISTERKRSFLLQHLEPLFLNLSYVASRTAAYAETPVVENLIAFPKITEHQYLPGSWRDSNAGYGNGRFAMDINVIWAPKALEAMKRILVGLQDLGVEFRTISKPDFRQLHTAFMRYRKDPSDIERTLLIWKKSIDHFRVKISSMEIEHRINASLNWLDAEEREYWQKNLGDFKGEREFLALSLDSVGKPLPIMNTDPATLLILHNYAKDLTLGKITLQEFRFLVDPIVTPYPYGLFVQNLGPLVANDVLASEYVRERFKKDHYHSPRVVWGREVNLILLGLSKQIVWAENLLKQKESPLLHQFIDECRRNVRKIHSSVEASGLKHNELWSYRVEAGKLTPSRYASSTDIQLWNVTDLAVQFYLNHIQIDQ